MGLAHVLIGTDIPGYAISGLLLKVLGRGPDLPPTFGNVLINVVVPVPVDPYDHVSDVYKETWSGTTVADTHLYHCFNLNF